MKMKRPSNLQLALGLSLGLHALLLGLKIADPARFDKLFTDTPLEVILVNSASKDKPRVAQAVAQHNLAGGGASEKGRATSPTAASALTQAGDSPEEARRQIEKLQAQQVQLLTQLKKQLAALPAPQPEQLSETRDPASVAREEKRRLLMSTLAEIENRINIENQRPRKHYVSPATLEKANALYYDAMRRRIEQQGTLAFPTLAGQQLYGELTLILSINFEGRMLSAEVTKGSGQPALDRQAQHIALRSAPFGAFTPAMRRQGDVHVLVSRFTFARDGSMQAVATPP